jgi:hypothetical protein
MTRVDYKFFYRQSARSAGLGMMIGPPFLAAVAITGAGFLSPDSTFMWIFSAIWILVAGLFFVIGLRRVIYGGQWGCFVDGEYMTWDFPHHMGRTGQQVAVQDITKFVVQIDRTADEMRYSYFIETPAGRFEIGNECFGRAGKLARALLEANPSIKLEVMEHGKTSEWDPDHAPGEFAAFFRQILGKRA